MRNSHNIGKQKNNAMMASNQATLDISKVNQSLNLGHMIGGNMTYVLSSPKEKVN
jgi:hypothetical protein